MGRRKLSDTQLNQPDPLRTAGDVSKLIGVSEPTLRGYKKLALFFVPDYRAVNLVNGETKVRQPLTVYQVWVLGKIAKLFGAIPQGCSGRPKIKQWLKDNGDRVLTYQAFRKETATPLQEVKK